MSDNKSIAIDFIESVNRDGIRALLRFATDDMRWWAAGMGEFAPEELTIMVESVLEQLEEPMKFTIHDVIGEGDKVAAEVESYAKLLNGNVYNNKYHFKFILRGGKIAHISEYHDTQHAFSVLGSDTPAVLLEPRAGVADGI